MPINDLDFWRLEEHCAVPPLAPPPTTVAAAGCTPLCFRGPTFRGRPSKVFAWAGLPAHASPDQPVPAIVLVHGGLGTAFAEWVRMWTARGYAAIALDHGGAYPQRRFGAGKADRWRRLNQPGPSNCGGFRQHALDPHDRWNYHAVANIIRAHSLLRSHPAVDSTRTAITGISWGGYLTCLAASLDNRFQAAATIYGCGHLDQSVPIGQQLAALPDHGAEWQQRFEPRDVLQRCQVPMLFVNGTNDSHFSVPMWQQSTTYSQATVQRSLRLRLAHSHHHGWQPPEIAQFIAQYTNMGEELPRLENTVFKDGTLQATVQAASVHGHGSLLWTVDTGPWRQRVWQEAPAKDHSGIIKASLTPHATAAVLNYAWGNQQGPQGHKAQCSSAVWLAEDSVSPHRP